MSISQALKQHILPKQFDGITAIQRKRIKNYLDLVGTLGENNKLADVLLQNNHNDDL